MPKINIPASAIKQVNNAMQHKKKEALKNLSDKDKERARQIIKDSLYSIIKVEIKPHRDIQLTLEHEGQVYREEYKTGQELLKYLEKFFNGIMR